MIINSAITSALNAMGRNFPYPGGFGQFIADILSQISTGTVGSTAAGADIDAVCLGGGQCTPDPDTTSAAGAGLTFGYQAGRMRVGQNIVNISAGTIRLAASSANYVEADATGKVSANTSGFTAGRCRLWIVNTGVATVSLPPINPRALLECPAPHAVTAGMVSTALATKSLTISTGDVTGGNSWIMVVPAAGNVSAAVFCSATAVPASDASYWSMSLVNHGQGGEKVAMVASDNWANSTRAAGGAAMTAFVPRELNLNAGNLSVAAGDVLEFALSAAGTNPPPISRGVLRVDVAASV